MKILIIRHGDPNYETDSLTEKGWREAEMLSERIAPMDITNYYVSPLGRAQDTASITLKKSERRAKTLNWLSEFMVRVDERSVPWDMLPGRWTKIDEYYDKNKWINVPLMSAVNMKVRIKRINNCLDDLLEEHGYKRKENIYKVISPNEDTIVMFCHFGIQCVMIGHLLGISPMVLWHGFNAAPTSVTTLITEERCEGIAYFRLNSFGDISHLYAKNEEPAFAGRFCEMFTNSDQRHD